MASAQRAFGLGMQPEMQPPPAPPPGWVGQFEQQGVLLYGQNEQWQLQVPQPSPLSTNGCSSWALPTTWCHQTKAETMPTTWSHQFAREALPWNRQATVGGSDFVSAGARTFENDPALFAAHWPQKRTSEYLPRFVGEDFENSPVVDGQRRQAQIQALEMDAFYRDAQLLAELNGALGSALNNARKHDLGEAFSNPWSGQTTVETWNRQTTSERSAWSPQATIDVSRGVNAGARTFENDPALFAAHWPQKRTSEYLPPFVRGGEEDFENSPVVDGQRRQAQIQASGMDASDRDAQLLAALNGALGSALSSAREHNVGEAFSNPWSGQTTVGTFTKTWSRQTTCERSAWSRQATIDVSRGVSAGARSFECIRRRSRHKKASTIPSRLVEEDSEAPPVVEERNHQARTPALGVGASDRDVQLAAEISVALESAFNSVGEPNVGEGVATRVAAKKVEEDRFWNKLFYELLEVFWEDDEECLNPDEP